MSFGLGYLFRRMTPVQQLLVLGLFAAFWIASFFVARWYRRRYIDRL